MSNKEYNLAHQTIRNSVYSFFSLVWPTAVSLIMTPIIMHKLGVSNYGIFLVVNVFIGFLSLLDFGLIPTLIKAIAYNHEKGDNYKLFKIINSSLTIYLVLGVVVSIIIFAARSLFFSLLNIDIQSPQVFLVTALIVVIFTANGFRSVIASILNGLQRYDLSAKVMVINVVFVNVLMLAFVYGGLGYISLIFAQLLSIVFLIVGYYYFVHKLIPEWSPRFEFSAALVKPELRFGSFVFINQVSSTILFQLDKLLLSALLGPAVVPYYSLPGTVAQKTQDVSSSLSGVLFPLATKLHVSSDFDRFKMIYRRVIYTATSVMAALTFAIVVYSRQIMQYWLGNDFAEKSARTLVILALTYFLLSLLLPVGNFLLGRGRSKELALFNLFIAALGVIMFIALVPIFGLDGAATAYLISVLPIPIFIYYVERKIFKLTESLSFYSKLFAKLIICSLVSYAISFLLAKIITNLLMLLVCIGLSLLIFVSVYYLFGFLDKEDEKLFKSSIKRLAHLN